MKNSDLDITQYNFVRLGGSIVSFDSVVIEEASLSKLPDNLVISGDLYVYYSEHADIVINSLPKGLEVTGRVILCKYTKLDSDKMGEISMSNSNHIDSLPEDLKKRRDIKC